MENKSSITIGPICGSNKIYVGALRVAMREIALNPVSYTHLDVYKRQIKDSGLSDEDVSNERTGIIVGSGGPSTRSIVGAAELTKANVSPKRIGPFAVPKAMCSGVSAALATWFKIKGVNYSISSACATSAHCICLLYTSRCV